MSFFENLGKKVGEAAQAAARKSSEIVEVTNNASINAEEDKIQKLYSEIGKVFETSSRPVQDELVRKPVNRSSLTGE